MKPLCRILLVDDNPNDRLLVKRELKREFVDLEINEIIDQAGLKQALQTYPFDLVITDYQLQWMTGLEVLKAVKAANANCPVIMFTNTGTQETAVAAMKAGLDDYVVKSPQHFVRLSASVRLVWEQMQTRLRATALETRLQSLLNRLNVGLFELDRQGHLLEVNQALLTLLGLSSAEAAQQGIHHQLQPRLDIAAALPQKREVQIQTQGADLKWLRVRETRSPDKGEAIIEGLVEDITAQKQAELALQQLNQRLESQVTERTNQLKATNQELELFAYSVSHDLRSPIRQINGFARLLSDHLQNVLHEDETAQHYLEVISSLSVETGEMIEDLLAFSRTGKVKLEFSPVDTNQLVGAIIERLKTETGDRSIRWVVQPLPIVWADANLLRTVFQNLIENAVKFTRLEAIAEITIGAEEPAEETIFWVKDNGIGLDMSYSDRLFGIFQRGHSQSEFEGTGIGLANVRRIIHRHGGRVWFEGVINAGATFYFALPRSEDRADFE
ncbi:ATP-binding protein [Almyronema epifaneia]|uniref:histidine kinase n=1 Tax=Almyronema epifaneia S1 TaxID=2991925 RepID=A0ABW6IEQ8_9CYAN